MPYAFVTNKQGRHTFNCDLCSVLSRRNFHPDVEFRIHTHIRRFHFGAEQFRHCARRIRAALAPAGSATPLPHVCLSPDAVDLSGTDRVDPDFRAHQQAGRGTVWPGNYHCRSAFLFSLSRQKSRLSSDSLGNKKPTLAAAPTALFSPGGPVTFPGVDACLAPGIGIKLVTQYSDTDDSFGQIVTKIGTSTD